MIGQVDKFALANFVGMCKISSDLAIEGRMINFIDLQRQQQKIREKVLARVEQVLSHGQYIMGPEVAELEAKLQSFSGAPFALSCSNGTDALMLALMALEVKPGDAVLCPSFTFVASAEVIPSMGATPVFVDVDPLTFNISIESMQAGIMMAHKLGLTPRGVIVVDLFGLPADYDRISEIAQKYDLWVLSDAAQSFGSEYKGRRAGSISGISTTSFFPAKPLGGYGDGGAVFCHDKSLKEKIESLRSHGMGEDRYINVRVGMNGRLDTIQAAVLLEKLAVFESELSARSQISRFYSEHLGSYVQVPHEPIGYKSAWAQYTIRLPDGVNRDQLQEKLKGLGVPSVVYYPIPLHKQLAYHKFPRANSSLEVSESLSSSVLSLPFHPYLSLKEQEHVVDAVKQVLKSA